jgi:ATP synthase protein I
MNIPAVSDGSQRAAWGATVGTAVALQWAVILALAGVAWLWGGKTSAMSLLSGGASVALPNALLAVWLTLRMRRPGGAGVAALFGGELLKLALTITLLVIVVRGSPDVSWLALIIGVIGALKAQWLALWFTRNI